MRWIRAGEWTPIASIMRAHACGAVASCGSAGVITEPGRMPGCSLGGFGTVLIRLRRLAAEPSRDKIEHGQRVRVPCLRVAVVLVQGF